MGENWTPGPWEAIQNDDPRGQPVPYYRALIAVLQQAPERYLSVVAKNDGYVMAEQWPHNARLIASVHDYRDACLLAKAFLEPLADAGNQDAQDVVLAIDTAELKAKGEIPQ